MRTPSHLALVDIPDFVKKCKASPIEDLFPNFVNTPGSIIPLIEGDFWPLDWIVAGFAIIGFCSTGYFLWEAVF